jgi:hypothetical protein
MGASNHFAIAAGVTARALLGRVIAMVGAGSVLVAVVAAPAAAGGPTALAVQAAGPARYVLGSDRRLHIDYDLVITNSFNVQATLKSLVVTARGRRILTLNRNALAAHTHQVTAADGTVTVPPSSTVVTLVDVVLPRSAAVDVPERLTNHIGYALPAGATLRRVVGSYTVNAPSLRVDRRAPTVIAPPLRGSGWLDGNGCCNPATPHRSALLPVNGTYVTIEMFAIDWIRVVHGADFDGAGTKLTDYKAFGARVYAVASGTVTSSKNNRPEAPLTQPPTDNPFVTTADEFPGNNVIEKIGRGKYAVYAHLQPGSVSVRPGQRIRAGQTLGLLGNSGNSTAPHLHFSIQDGPNPLTSDSLPYVFDHYRFQGDVTPGSFSVVTGTPHRELRSYPLAGVLANFSRGA